MRKMLCVVVAVLVQGSAARAQTPAAAPAPALRTDQIDAATRRALFAARDSVWRAWFAGDSTALMHLLPPALAAGSRNGWETREASIASGRKFAASGGKLLELTFDSTSLMLRGDVAVLRAQYHYVLDTGSDRTSRGGTATEVFVRRDGHWVNPFWYLE